MPIPLGVIIRLLVVIHSYVNEDLPVLDNVIIDGHLNDTALHEVKLHLTQTGREDMLEMLRQTIQGNFTLLEESERLLHDGNRQNRLTQNNMPVRYETSGRTSNTISHRENLAQNERHDSAVPPREARDARKPPHEEEHKEEESSHQLSSREPAALQSTSSSTTNLPEEPHAPHCCICGKYIQDIQTCHQVWLDVRRTLAYLEREQLLNVIHEINAYDPTVLNTIQFNQATPFDALVNNVIQSLQGSHLAGSKCILCLLNYALQKVGRQDLASEIRMIIICVVHFWL